MSTVTPRAARPMLHPMSPESKPAPPRRGWWKWLLAAVPLGLIAVWLLPMLVAHSPLFSWFLAGATSDLHGQVHVGSASLGWFSPIRLEEIEIRDQAGDVVLAAPRVQGKKSLVSILFNTLRPGHYRLEKPAFHLRLRKDGSNVEDLLAEYLAPSEEPASEIDFGLEIVDGTVSIADESGKREWKVDQFALTLAMSADGARPLELQGSGVTKSPTTDEGRFEFGLKMNLGDGPASEENAEDGSARFTLQAHDLPLGLSDLVMERFAPDARMSGRLDAEVACGWDPARPAGGIQMTGELSASQFVFESPSLQGDQVRLKELKATCKIASKEDRLQVDQLALASDVGNLELVGSFQTGEGTYDEPQALLRQTYTLQGNVEVEKLAAMLPRALHLHEQTEVTSGDVTLSLTSRKGEDGMVWEGDLRTSDLTAMRRGKELVWHQPIRLTLAAHEGKKGTVIENLECAADFLKVRAAGTREKMSASANFDLDKLAGRLGGFVDLRGLQLAGSGWAYVNWSQSKEHNFETDAELQIRDLMIAVPQNAPWQEANLLAFLSAKGRTQFDRNTRLEEATLEMRSGEEKLKIALTGPVPNFQDGGVWPMSLSANGELERWVERLRPWIDLEPLALEGAYQLALRGTGSKAGIQLGEATATMQDFLITTADTHVAQRDVQVQLAGRYDHRERRMLLTRAQLTSDTLRLEAEDAIVGMPETGPLELAGDIRYRGDLTRLQQWLSDPTKPMKCRVGGTISGEGRIKQTGGMAVGQLDNTIEHLVVQGSSGRQYYEPRVHLVARGSYEQQKQLLNLEQLQLEADPLNGAARGKLSSQDERTDVQLTGQLNYDLDKLSALLYPYFGAGVRVVGRGTAPVSYRGPLSLAEAQAGASMKWLGANLYGFQVGQGELRASLAEGMLRFEPIAVDVSQGRLSAAPRLRLAPGPMELQLDPGPLVERVTIDPAMCSHALQYIAPVLAGVATAEGQFSIHLDDCRVPLAEPATGDVSGQFVVHAVQIGPGPLIRELAILLGGGSAASLSRESRVRFRMVDGRVYHEGLELVFPDVTVRTHGWVGLDHTLAMVAEMPIPPQWTEKLGASAKAALRDQTLRLPISGTLERPRIDRREFDRLSQRFLQSATRNLLQDELNKQLNRLFNPPRK